MAEGEVPLGQATPPDIQDKAVSEAAASPKAMIPKAKAKGRAKVNGKGPEWSFEKAAASEETTKPKKKPAVHGCTSSNGLSSER